MELVLKRLANAEENQLRRAAVTRFLQWLNGLKTNPWMTGLSASFSIIGFAHLFAKKDIRELSWLLGHAGRARGLHAGCFGTAVRNQGWRWGELTAAGLGCRPVFECSKYPRSKPSRVTSASL